MYAVISFSSICLLLVLGNIARFKIKAFRKFYVPSSVIAGLIGLIILNVPGLNVPAVCTAGWTKLPGFLINIIFASLFLGVKIPGISTIWKKSGPQLAYGQIVAWGQYLVGIGITLILLVPLFKVPGYFGTIIPVGFEGGHGTAAGLRATFEMLKWSDGADLALAAATTGIISAIILGTVLINWAVRRGYTQKLKKNVDINKSGSTGVYDPKDRPVAGFQTVSAISVDSLALHLAIVGIAVLIGYGIKLGLAGIGNVFLAPEQAGFMNAFPLFPLCMLGGVAVQLFLSRVLKVDIIDHTLMQRVSGTALDFLVVAAISMISLSVVSKSMLPFAIVVIVGILWNVFCVMFLAKRLLPDAWFERAIAEMGQSMGVTATGLLLLRVVDPDAETPAYYAFGYKQLLHEPFMGGGLWTAMAIPLAITVGPGLVLGISAAAIAVWAAVWFFFLRNSNSQEVGK